MERLLFVILSLSCLKTWAVCGVGNCTECTNQTVCDGIGGCGWDPHLLGCDVPVNGVYDSSVEECNEPCGTLGKKGYRCTSPSQYGGDGVCLDSETGEMLFWHLTAVDCDTQPNCPPVPEGSLEFVEQAVVSSRIIVDDSVTSEKFADQTLDSDDFANNIIGSLDIAVDQVGVNLIGDYVVSNTHIVDGAVTSEKVLDGAVTDVHIQNLALTETSFGDESITSDSIANNTFTLSYFSDGAITTEHLIDSSINSTLLPATASRLFTTGAKLADGIVTIDTLATGQLTADKLTSTFAQEIDVTGSIEVSSFADSTIIARHVTTQSINSRVIKNGGLMMYNFMDSDDLVFDDDDVLQVPIINRVLMNKTVETPFIANAIITADHFANSSIEGRHVVQSQIKTRHLAPRCIHGRHIKNDSLILRNIEDGTVSPIVPRAQRTGITSAHIMDYSLNGAMSILTNQITADKIALKTISRANFQNQSIIMENLLPATFKRQHLIDEGFNGLVAATLGVASIQSAIIEVRSIGRESFQPYQISSEQWVGNTASSTGLGTISMDFFDSNTNELLKKWVNEFTYNMNHYWDIDVKCFSQSFKERMPYEGSWYEETQKKVKKYPKIVSAFDSTENRYRSAIEDAIKTVTTVNKKVKINQGQLNQLMESAYASLGYNTPGSSFPRETTPSSSLSSRRRRYKVVQPERKAVLPEVTLPFKADPHGEHFHQRWTASVLSMAHQLGKFIISQYRAAKKLF